LVCNAFSKTHKNMHLEARRIIGIDPGTNILGYAVIEVVNKEIRILGIDVLKMQKTDDHPAKLKEIFENIQKIVAHFKPTEMALEAPFFGKNVQAMLKLGRAQGVAMAAGLTAGLSINEYSPKKVKQSVTGNGNATKEQVAAMLSQTFKKNIETEYLDATDALGVAVCHYYQTNLNFGGAKFKDWKDFIVKSGK
jgi:crossover junction endodeoxyribonuclease RuvC